jgi:hypothetical protein
MLAEAHTLVCHWKLGKDGGRGLVRIVSALVLWYLIQLRQTRVPVMFNMAFLQLILLAVLILLRLTTEVVYSSLFFFLKRGGNPTINLIPVYQNYLLNRPCHLKTYHHRKNGFLHDCLVCGIVVIFKGVKSHTCFSLLQILTWPC